jgi:hypothetical protein
VGFINQYGEVLNLTKFLADRDYIEKGTVFFEKYILNMPIGASVFIGAVMARRDCYQKLGGFNPVIPNVNDSEMWMRMLLFYDVACIGKKLVNYRLHDLMTSTAINDKEGLNIPGLQEHFLACRIVLEKYPDRIPHWKQLNGKVATAFSLRAVTRGVGMLRKGDIGQSISYFKTARQFDPLIVSRKALWAFMMSLIVKNIRKIKN